MRELLKWLAAGRQPSVYRKFSGRTIRFDRFVLCPESGELYEGDRAIVIHPQPLKVLTLLTRFPGQLVTRAAIQKELWGEATIVDFDVGINHCIRQIRAALGDDAKAPRYVMTVPRRGYRFLADVEVRPAPDTACESRQSWWRAMQERLTYFVRRQMQV